jgi:hypothetical protein
MPVYKYKTFEAAERALWTFRPDADTWQNIADLWAFADQLAPITYPRGIFKFRTIEEANRHRDEYERQFARQHTHPTVSQSG